MSTDNDRIRQLEESYRKLWEEHLALKERIRSNYAEFKDFCEGKEPVKNPTDSIPQPEPVIVEKAISPVEEVRDFREPAAKPVKEKTTWEQYIGEQLLSKIGIAVVIIGVGIGAKYAIDHQLLSPAMRILGGYIVAGILGFFAFRFREKYTSFSAVLTSGAMAVSYFITYAAYTFYHLYPYWLTFALLLLTTVGTVVTAIRYNAVIIAHIGLAGAYFLPILISARQNNMSDYLLYLAVINTGILAVSLLRKWRSLHYVSFGWTVLIFSGWFLTSFREHENANSALFYLSFFFVLFQLASTGYPFFHKERFRSLDLWVLVPNTLIYFGFAQYVLKVGEFSPHADFIFGWILSVLFIGLWYVFRRLRQKELLLQIIHVLIGCGILTINLLSELKGNTLHFSLILQATLLAWLAVQAEQKEKGWAALDVFAAVLVGIAGLMLSSSAYMSHGLKESQSAFLNGGFGLRFSCFVLAAATGFVLLRSERKQQERRFLSIPALGMYAFVTGYSIITAELIGAFGHWLQTTEIAKGEWMYAATGAGIAKKLSLVTFTVVWWLLIPLTDRYLLRMKGDKSWMSVVSVIIGTIALLVFSYLIVHYSNVSGRIGFDGIRNLSRYVLFGGLIWMILPWLRSKNKESFFLLAGHAIILWIMSLEMIHWLSETGSHSTYKLSLSILWTVYAVYLLYMGIQKNFAGLRITAMVILGITLVKLFFYDVAHLSTPLKTVLFIAVGGLLLVGAYFYQRNMKQGKKEQLPTDGND